MKVRRMGKADSKVDAEFLMSGPEFNYPPPFSYKRLDFSTII